MALEALARWLVQQPLHILFVAAIHFAFWLAGRATSLRRAPVSNVLWVPGVAWLAYAAWEWWVQVASPEANIRFDLLLIWPIVGVATVWAVARAGSALWRGRGEEGPSRSQ